MSESYNNLTETESVSGSMDPRLDIPSSSVNPANFTPDYETFLDKLDFSPMTEKAYGPSPVNPDTALAIEKAAIPINALMSNAYNDANSPTPGRVSGTNDPWAERGIPDLKTKEGRNQRLAQAFGNAIDQTGVDMTPGARSPMTFGSKAFNLDRMMAHPKYEDLGYHPLYDNESYYNKNSHWMDDSNRMWKQYGRMFGNAFTSSYRSIGDAINGNWTWGDDEGAHIMEDAMRIGSSSRGGMTQWLNNTWLSSSYTIGIMSSIAVEEAALALATVGSGFTLSGVTIPKMFQTAASGVKGIYNGVKGMGAALKTLNVLKVPETAKDFWNTFNGTRLAAGIGKTGKWTADFLTPTTMKAFKDLRTSAATGENLSNLAKTQKLFGAFYRDVRMMNLAVAESRLEAGLVENETFSKLYQEFTHANGRMPNQEEMKVLRGQALDAARTTFLFNAPVIYLSNKLVLEKWMAKAKPLKSLIAMRGMGAKFVKAPGKFGKDVYKGFKNWREMLMAGGLRHNARYVGGAALRYSADGVVEGMQEVFQETISAAATHYYAGLYQQPIATGYDIMKMAQTKPTDDMAKKALQHGLQHGPSWEIFASGFFTGMMVGPYNQVVFQGIPNLFQRVTNNEQYQKDKASREKFIEDTEKWLNEMAQDPKFYFDPMKLNVALQKQLSMSMTDNQYSGNVLDFVHDQEQMRFSHIYTSLELGKLDEFRSYINDIQKLSDQELEEAFDNKDGYTAEELRKHFDGINKKLDTIQENYDKFDDQYINPFNRNKFKEGTREYYEESIREYAFRHAKMQMIFNNDAMENASEYLEKIKNNLANNLSLSKIGLDKVLNLTSKKGIETEIQTLKKEIEGLKWATTKEDKKRIKELRKELKLLEAFEKVLTDPKNQHKSTQEVKNAKKVKKKGISYQRSLVGWLGKWEKEGQKKLDEAKGKNKVKKPTWGKLKGEGAVSSGSVTDGDVIYNYEIYDDGTFIYNADLKVNETTQKAFQSKERLQSHIKKQKKTIYETVIDAKTGKPKKVRTEKGAVAFWMTKYKRDPESMKKLMKVFVPYLEHLVEVEGGKMLNQDQLQDTLTMMVDYGHLQFRINDLMKANRILSDPKMLKRYSERIAVPMKQLWTRFKNNQGRRVRGFIDKEIRKEFLKTLAKAGIFADPDQVKHFMSVETLTEADIPSDYYAEDGEIINDWMWGHTNKDQYETMMFARQKLIDEVIAPSKEGKAKEEDDEANATIDDSSTAEETLNEDDATTEEEKEEIKEKKRVLNEYKADNTDLKSILQREYNKYREEQLAKNKPVLTAAEWLNHTKFGAAIVSARREVHVVYDDDERRDEFSNFNDWLKEHIRSDRVQNIIEKHGLQPYQILLEDVIQSKTLQEGVLLEGEIQAPKFKNTYADYDLFIIQVPTQFVGGKQRYTYIIKNSKGQNVYDAGIYNNLNLSPNIFAASYDTAGQANEAIKAILKAIPESTTFKFDNMSFQKGERVINNGKNYTILSDVADIKSKGYMLVRDEQFPEAEPIKITPGTFKSEGWTKDENVQPWEEINIEGRNVQRLSRSKGLTFGMPLDFELAKNTTIKNKADLQNALKNMEPEQRKKLAVVITRAKQPHKNEGKDVDMKYGEVNPLLKRGSRSFNVVLINTETNEVLGRLDGLNNYIFIDKKTGEEITPLDMTIDNVFDYFINSKAKTGKEQLEEIQQNYAQLTLIEDLFDRLLKDSGTKKLTLRFDKLAEGKNTVVKDKDLLEEAKDIFFALTPGRKLITPKGEKDYETPIKDLDYKSINKAGNIYIIDNSPLGDDITDLEFEDAERIREEIDRQGLGGLKGRYILAVRTPANYDGGYFHLFEIRTQSQSKEDIQKIFNSLIAQQKKTVAENITEKGKVIKNKQKGLGYDFNKAFNESELLNKMYIAMPHGHNAEISLMPSGDIQVKFKQTKDAGGVSFTINLNRDTINKAELTSMQDLFDLVSQKAREVFDNELKKNPQFIVPLGFGIETKSTAKDSKNPRGLQTSQVRYVIERSGPNIEELQSEGVVAIAAKEVVGDIKAELRYSNSTEVQSLINQHKAKKQIKKEIDNPSIIANDISTIERYEQEGWHHYPKAALEALAIKMLTDEENLTDAEKTIIAKTDLETKLKTKEIEVNVETITEGGVGTEGNETNEELIQKKKRIEEKIAIAEDQAHDRINKQIESEHSDKTEEEKNEIYDEEIRKWEENPEDNYKKLQEERNKIIQQIKSGKIIRNNNFDGNDVIDIEEFIAWAKENLPSFINIEDIENFGENLARNGMTIGTFVLTLRNIAGKINVDGTIYTGAKSPFKYHEAFHAVFQMLLTDTEIKKYYGLAQKEIDALLKSKKGYRYQGKTYHDINKLLKDFRQESPLYDKLNLSDLKKRLYEEYMADEFEKFKLNPKNTKTNSAIKNFFTRIIEWIKSIFREFSGNDLQSLYEKIDSGKFRNTTIQENVFTKPASAAGTITRKSAKIVIGSQIIEKEVYNKQTHKNEIQTVEENVYMSASEEQQMKMNIAALFLIRRSKKKELNEAGLLKKTIQDYINIFNPQLARHKKNPNYRKGFRKELAEKYDYLKNATDDLMREVKNELAFYDINIDLSNIEEIGEIEEATAGGTQAWDMQANQRGGVQKLAQFLRIFIGTTTMPSSEALLEDQIYGIQKVPKYQINEKGQEVLVEGNEDLVVSVNARIVYNGMLKSVGNSTSQLEVLQKLIMFGRNNPQTGAVVDRIMTEAGILKRDYDNILKYDPSTPVGVVAPMVNNPIFLNLVIKQLSQFTSPYLRIENETNPESGQGVVSIYAANHSDDVAAQMNRARKRFFDLKTHHWETKKRGELSSKGARKGFFNFVQLIEKGKALNERDLDKVTREISSDIRNLVGIDLSIGFIKYSILHQLNNKGVELNEMQTLFLNRNSDAYAMTLEDAKIISGLLKNNIDIMSRSKTRFSEEVDRRQKEDDVDITKDGAEGRLKNIFKGNAEFDENVGATVFVDEKGDFIYSHQLPTYHLTKVAEINKGDIEGLDALMLGDGYLNANFLLNNPAFRQLIKDGKLRIGRVSGKTNVWNVIDTETNTKVSSRQTEGIPFSEFGDADFLTALINLKLAPFNKLTGNLKKKDTVEYNVEGVDKPILNVLSPVFIRVIADSSTGDLVGLPVLQAVKFNKEGAVEFTDEYLNSIEGFIENEYNRILEESRRFLGTNEDVDTVIKKVMGTGNIKGFNEATSITDIKSEEKRLKEQGKDPAETDRAFKMTNNAQLVTAMIREGKTLEEAITKTAGIKVEEDINKALKLLDDPTAGIIKLPAFVINKTLKTQDGKKRLAETQITLTPRTNSKGEKIPDKVEQRINVNEFTLEEFHNQITDMSIPAVAAFVNKIIQNEKNQGVDVMDTPPTIEEVLNTIKEVTPNLEAAYTFLILHEQFHIDNDHYLDIEGVETLSEEAETAANEHAFYELFKAKSPRYGVELRDLKEQPGKYLSKKKQDRIPEELVVKLVDFLERYGFDLHHSEDFFINLANKDIKLDFGNIAEMSKALAGPLAVMLSHSTWYHTVRNTLKNSKTFKDKVDSALPKPREEMDPKEVYAIQNKILMNAWKQLLENGFQERFKKELNISDTLWGQIRKFLNELLQFLKQLTADERFIIKTQVDQVVDNAFRGGLGGIATTAKPGYVKVDLQQAFDQLEIAKEIQTKIGINPKIILTGSIAYATEGTIYRDINRVVHDLDYISEMTPEENEKLLLDNFPGAVLGYNFGKPSHVTHTYIVPPKGYFIDKKSIIRKQPENLKEGEQQLDETKGKIIGYNVVDKKGKIVGTWKLNIDETGTELNEEATGINATFVDFFTSNKNEHRTKTTTFEGTDGQKHTIRISSFESGMEFKLAFGRFKDIVDYNRFRKNGQKNSITSPREEEEINIIDKKSYKPDTTVKDILEDFARRGVPFEEVKAELEKRGIPLMDVVQNRLNFEFDRFISRLFELDILFYDDNNNLMLRNLDPQLQTGFKSGKKNLNAINQDFNFEAGELLFNLRQIFFDDYRNTKSFNEVLFGDQAQVYKNVIEAIKRAKGSNASGMNVEWGFTHKVSDTLTIHPSYQTAAFVHKDPVLDQNYGAGKQEIQDALVTMSLRGFAHYRAGLGKLSEAQSELIDDLIQGREVRIEDLLGNGIDTTGILQNGQAINSKKMVYDDGKVYIKMSIRVLTPDFTTDLETGEALPGMEELHNLRKKIEEKEEELFESNQTKGLDHFIPVMAVPESASKKFKENLAEPEDAYNEKPIDTANVQILNNKFMKLQQVVPSNKIEIVDPKQIINLLTNEQYDPNVEVSIAGTTYTVAQVRKMYEKATGLRREFAFTNVRNLIVTLNGQHSDAVYNRLFKEHLDLVKRGEVQIDLTMFKKFALNSLMSAQSKAQLLEFFDGDYNLNNPFTEPKFQQLYFSFWKSGFADKQPGHSLTLVSDVGFKVVKKVIAVDEVTGEPIRWEVIPRQTWMDMQKNPEKYGLDKAPGLAMDNYADQDSRTFGKGSLKKGNYYLDNLRHHVMEYDENNKPTGVRFSEFAMPPHFATIAKYWRPGMPIPDVLSKGFGIRIPTQDKHSAANMKVVDFMPIYFGSSVIVPREITEISGSDFDIDTLYTHFKEFFLKKTIKRTSDEIEADWNKYVTTPHAPRDGGPLVIRRNIEGFDVERSKAEYANMMTKKTGLDYSWNRDTGKFEPVYEAKFMEFGTAETINQEYEEYIRYMIKEAKKPGSVVAYALEKYQEKQGILPSEKLKLKDLIDIDYNDPWEKIVEYFNDKDDNNKYKNRLLLNVLKTEMHLPNSLDTYKEYKRANNNGSEAVGGVVPYKGAYNNRILDFKFALLGNKNISEPQAGQDKAPHNESANLLPLDNPPDGKVNADGVYELVNNISPAIWQLIKAKAPLLAQQLEEGYIDIDNMYGKSVMKSANAMGTNIVGAAVQPNVVTSIFNAFGIKVVDAIRYRQVIKPLRLNNITYDDYSTNFLINPETGEQDPSRRKAYVISAIITALTDNAKEQLTGKTGLQLNALGIVVNMLALGVDSQTAFGMINHPTVKYILANPGLGLISTIDDTIGTLLSDLKEVKGVKEKARKNVTSEMLWDHIKDGSENTYTQGLPIDNVIKAETVQVLQQLKSIAYTKQFTSKVIKLVELLKKAPDDLSSMNAVKMAAFDLGLDLTDQQINNKLLQPPFDVRPIFENMDNHMGQLWQQTKELDAINSNVFIASTEIFNKIQSLLQDSVLTFGQQGQINKDRIKNNILSYLMLLAYKNAGIKIDNLTNGLLYPQIKGVKISSIIKRMNEILQKRGVDGSPQSNYFLTFYISLLEANQGNEIDEVVTNTFTQLSDSEIMRIQTSFLELLNPNDPEMANLARTLVGYLLVKDGMQYKAGSFVNAIPAHVFENYMVHLDRIHNVLQKFTDVENMSSDQRKLLTDELTEIFGENFNTVAGTMIYKMLIHQASRNMIRGTYDVIEQEAKKVVMFNKGSSTQPATLIYDISSDTGSPIPVYEGPLANVPVPVIENKELNKNFDHLGGRGKRVKILIKNNGETKVVELAQFPLYVEMNYSAFVNGVPRDFTKLFRLKRIYSPINENDRGSRNNLFNVLDENQAVGYRAEYEDVTGKEEGSSNQWAGGSIWNQGESLPLTTIVKSNTKEQTNVEEEKKQANKKGKDSTGNYENKVTGVKANENSVEVTTVNGNIYNSNEVDLNNAMNQEGEVGKGGSVLDITGMTGTPRKTYSGKVTTLNDNQIFVFGSNPEGRHGAGAAKLARTKFGAIYGQGEGLQGQSYALPTKDLRVKENKSLRSISPEDITNNIRKLYEVARQNPNKEFLIPDYTGKNLNGYTEQELAEMFNAAGPIPNNIIFNDNFQDTLSVIEAFVVTETEEKWKKELKKRIEAYNKEQEKLKDRMFDITSESGEDVGGLRSAEDVIYLATDATGEYVASGTSEIDVANQLIAMLEKELPNLIQNENYEEAARYVKEIELLGGEITEAEIESLLERNDITLEEDSWEEDVVNMSDEEILDVIPETKEQWDILVEDLELRIKELEEDSYGPDIPLTKKEGGETIKNQDAIKRDLKNKLQDLLNKSEFNEAEKVFAPIKNLDTNQYELDFNEEIGSVSNKMGKFMELWEELDPKEQEKIMEHYDYTAVGLIMIDDTIINMLMEKSPKEVIERLKKCS